MAKNTLPVDFQDDIMNSSMGGKRRYRVINNSDGTISLEDATIYDQVGSNFGAGQMNATNEAVNAAADAEKIIDDIEVIRNVTKEGYIAGARALKQVDDSLGGLEFTIIDGQPQWKERGADSFNPFKSNIKYIDVVLDGMSEYTFNSSSISDTAEIVGAGIVSRDYSGWMGVEVEYTASTVTAKNNVNFTDNCILRIWYSDTIFKMGGIIKWEFPVISPGGTHTFTIPEDGEFTLYVMSGKGWGCENLSIYSTTIDNYTILSEYHSENSAVGHAYMILNINAKFGDTITFSHGISNGADTVPFYALTYR